MLNLIRMASCVLITNCCVAAKHLLQFSGSGSTANSCCASLVLRSSSDPATPRPLVAAAMAGDSRDVQGQWGHATCAWHEETPTLNISLLQTGLLTGTFKLGVFKHPFATSPLIWTNISTHKGRNLCDLPPTQCFSIHISKNEEASLEPVSSMPSKLRRKEK